MKTAARKKTDNFDQDTVSKVRRHFNVKTDSEAIRRALSQALEHVEIQHALDKLLRKGRFRVIYR